MKSNTITIRCTCSHSEHVMMIDHFEGEEEAYVHVHLAKQSFWRRVYYGIAYIFGRQCGYGAFEEIIIDKENTKELNAMLKKWHTSRKPVK